MRPHEYRVNSKKHHDQTPLLSQTQGNHTLLPSGAYLPLSALAQATLYPTKPVKIVVTLSPGSAPDVIARFLGDSMSRTLGQYIVIEDQPGAATIVGATVVAKAPPDGYTVMMSVLNTTAINRYIYQSLPYKADDFTAVVKVAAGP